MNTCVCIHRWQKPNEFVPSKDLESKTAAQIQNYLKAQDGNIFISTPLYRKPLEPGTVPLTEYKQLVLVEGKTLFKYPPTDFNLAILPKSNPNPNSLTFSIKTQFTEHVFPEMTIEYNPNNCKTVSDLIERATKLFDIGCENAKFVTIKDGNETELDSQYSVSEMLDLSIDRIKSNQTSPLFTFSCKIPDDTLSKISKRCQISSEVISSEESFVADLFQLDQYYKKKITDSKIFDDIQIKFIFRDVPCIVDTHKKLLGELKRITVNYSSEFGPVFLNFVESFKVSLSFISNYNAVDEMIKKKLTRSDALARFKEIEDKNESGKSFMSYYITPVQRYPRYPLLIRDLLKCTPDFHPDKPYLTKALNEIDSTNKSLDQTAHKIKQLVEIEEIEKITNHCIAEEGREFVIQKTVKITKPKSQVGILYLFNDIVFLAIKTKKGQSIVFGDNNNQFLQVSEFQFCNDRPTSDSIVAFIFQKEYTITFESYSEKTVWMDAFYKVRTNQLSTINDKNKFAKWTDIEMGEQIYPLYAHDGIVYQNKAYFVGGLNQNNSNSSNMIIYDIGNDKWNSEPATGLTPRSFHTMVSYKDYMYVLFGQGYKSIFNDVYRSQGGEWAKVASSSTFQRYGHSVVLYNDKFYIFGGRNGEKILNDLVVFDPDKNDFKAVKVSDSSKAPSARYYHSATVYHDEMIVYGGKTSKNVSSDMYSFNFTTNEWKHLADIKLKPRFSHRSIVLSENYLFIIGGFQKNGYSSSTVVISLEDKKLFTNFTEYGNIPFCISKFSLVQLTENRALIYGGTDSTSKVPFSSSYIIDTEEGFDSEREYVEIKPKSKDRITIDIPELDSNNVYDPKPRQKERSTNDLIDAEKKKTEEEQKNSRNTVQLGQHSQNDLMSELHNNKLFSQKGKNRSLKDLQEESISSPNLIQSNVPKSEPQQRKYSFNPTSVDDRDLTEIRKKQFENSQEGGRKRANTLFPSLPTIPHIAKETLSKAEKTDTDEKIEEKTPPRATFISDDNNSPNVPIRSASSGNPASVASSSPTVRSVTRPPAQSAIIKSGDAFIPDPDIKLSSTFNENEFYRKFGIDVSQLPLIHKQQIAMKAKTAYRCYFENEELQNQINSLNMKGSLVLKISDVSKKTRILYFSADDSFDEISQKISQILGKDLSANNLSIQLPNETPTDLSEQSFEEYKQKLINENLPFMKISEK